MVLPNTFVDPWKPNPFAPIGSIWSESNAPAPANSSKPEDAGGMGDHRPLYATNSATAPVTEKSEAAEPLATNLSLNAEKSGETEIGVRSNDDNNADANGETDGSRPPYQGKKGGRGGRSGRGGGRSGRGGRGRGRGGREGRSSRNDLSTEPTDVAKTDDSNYNGKPSLGEDKRSGRGRGSGRGRSSGGRGKSFKKGDSKDKTSPKNEKAPAITTTEATT